MTVTDSVMSEPIIVMTVVSLKQWQFPSKWNDYFSNSKEVECKPSPTRANVYTETLYTSSPQGVGECLRAETTDQYTAVA